MKAKISLLISLSLFLLLSCNSENMPADTNLSENIRINQLGYFPDLEKNFTLADSSAEKFYLVNEDGKTVFSGKLKEFGLWEPSGEILHTGDFSEFNTEGRYVIFIPGVGKSYPFSITKELYTEAAIASLRSYYFMRTAMEMEEKYLGSFARPMGHPDDTCYFHPSTGRSDGFRPSPKGWYDAGDYGKYIINAAISTGTILAFYELFPTVFDDGALNIPESGNGINDLLDEIRYEMDWVLTMQDDDGGVFHKLTSLRHDGITMPHETFSKRYFIGKSTAASLDFAAMLAQASRLFNTIDPEFAETSLNAAIRAYEWAMANPEEYFSNPPGINTGGYGDNILNEEFFWAAAELYCTTGDQSYYETIAADLGKITFRLEESWRNYVDNIGYYSLYASILLNEQDRKILETGIINLADSLLSVSSTNGYSVPFNRFVWGSNSDILNNAMIQLYGHHITGEKKYLDAAAAITDYIFGENATGYSFVSGFGTKYSSNFHHRLLMADDNEDPFPGFVAGGPNFQKQDAYNLESQNAFYPSEAPARVYIDHDGSYASNEVCINWNAPLVFVLAYLNLFNQ